NGADEDARVADQVDRRSVRDPQARAVARSAFGRSAARDGLCRRRDRQAVQRRCRVRQVPGKGVDAMPKFAANLTMMYNEHPFLDRFGAAAADGFKGVEILFPYAFPAAEIKSRLSQHGLTLALFNMPPGNWD